MSPPSPATALRVPAVLPSSFSLGLPAGQIAKNAMGGGSSPPRGRQEREEVRVQHLSPSWARSRDGRLWILVGRTAGVERRMVSKEFTPHFLDFESRVGFVKKVHLTLCIQLVCAGLVCATMRGYRDAILGLLLGYGIVPQILFISSTLVTTISTHVIMRKKPELRQSFPRDLPLLAAYTTTWALYIGLYSLFRTGGTVMRAIFQSAFVVDWHRVHRTIGELQMSLHTITVQRHLATSCGVRHEFS